MLDSQIILILDPAVGSTNLGDEIISEAVSNQIRRMFPDGRVISIGSRNYGTWSRKVAKSADRIFFGGSNALSSNPVFGYRQFAMGFLEYLGISNVTLLGVGWWQYQDQMGPFARSLYWRMLSEDSWHSVRDEYTLAKMQSLGFEKVLNTACPTMWGLATFQTILPERAVLTLTDYNRNPERDSIFLRHVLAKFRDVYFWPQGTDDLQYLEALGNSLNLRAVRILKPNLPALDDALSEGPAYIGTRLHAGVRALQHQCAAYIVPIDNRSLEIAKTESLPLVGSNFDSIEPGQVYKFSYTARREVSEFLRLSL